MLTYSRSGIRSPHSDPAHAEYRLSVQFFEELCSTFYKPLPAQCWLFAGSASANTENCGHFLFTGRDSLFPPVVVIFPHVVVITQSFACRAALLRCLSTGGGKWRVSCSVAARGGAERERAAWSRQFSWVRNAFRKISRVPQSRPTAVIYRNSRTWARRKGSCERASSTEVGSHGGHCLEWGVFPLCSVCVRVACFRPIYLCPMHMHMHCIVYIFIKTRRVSRGHTGWGKHLCARYYST